MSPMFEIVIIHLKVGAQKKIVKGPAGCTRKERAAAGQGALSTCSWMNGTKEKPVICVNKII